jgi:hypothetical protein
VGRTIIEASAPRPRYLGVEYLTMSQSCDLQIVHSNPTSCSRSVQQTMLAHALFDARGLHGRELC